MGPVAVNVTVSAMLCILTSCQHHFAWVVQGKFSETEHLATLEKNFNNWEQVVIRTNFYNYAVLEKCYNSE